MTGVQSLVTALRAVAIFTRDCVKIVKCAHVRDKGAERRERSERMRAVQIDEFPWNVESKGSQIRLDEGAIRQHESDAVTDAIPHLIFGVTDATATAAVVNTWVRKPTTGLSMQGFWPKDIIRAHTVLAGPSICMARCPR
jgi:hypothetical protein